MSARAALIRPTLAIACVSLAVGIATARAASVQPESGPLAQLGAAFAPERLGQPTAVTVSLGIDGASGVPAQPLSSLKVRFPSDIGLATSGLGLATCEPLALEADGGRVCPANSKMGGGVATVAVALGSKQVRERVTLGLYAAPSDDGYVHISILAQGREPVIATLVMSAVLLSGELQITMPPVPSLPETPDVALVSLRATLGGALTYYERVRGRLIAYRPRGISLPPTCPRGGFALGAELGFQNGTRSSARHVVPCPARRAR